MINNIEFEILEISSHSVPYVYICRPVHGSAFRVYDSFYHESKIKKKTGLLKELE